MIKHVFLSVVFFMLFFAANAQAPIIVSDTEGNISEIDLPNNCNKRIITNVGRSLSDITLHPNGKMYGTSFSQEKLYEIDTTTGTLTEIISFPNIKLVGMTAAANGKIYISEGRAQPGRLFEVDITTNTYITKGFLVNGSAGDLTWYLGELYNASEDNKLVKINLDDPESSLVIGDFTNPELIFSLATNVYACDSSVTYGITEDRDYFTINMETAQTNFLCAGDGARIFGSTTTDEFRASDTCLIALDLDVDNSSGANGADFNDNFNCSNVDVNIADIDVKIKSGESIDSVVVKLIDGILDGNDESLQVGSSPNINSSNNTQTISAVNNGSASIENFETFLSTLKYLNVAVPASLGERTIEVIAYSSRGNSNTAIATITISGSADAGNDGSISFCF